MHVIPNIYTMKEILCEKLPLEKGVPMHRTSLFASFKIQTHVCICLYTWITPIGIEGSGGTHIYNIKDKNILV